VKALGAMLAAGAVISPAAIEISVTFYFAKPASASKNVIHKITRPDVDKCLRSILDALTGIVYLDDAQVVDSHSHKRFGLPERAEISINAIPVRAEASRLDFKGGCVIESKES
jgi:Holliday junction resolvase RusA-like endonuclease